MQTPMLSLLWHGTAMEDHQAWEKKGGRKKRRFRQLPIWEVLIILTGKEIPGATTRLAEAQQTDTVASLVVTRWDACHPWRIKPQGRIPQQKAGKVEPRGRVTGYLQREIDIDYLLWRDMHVSMQKRNRTAKRRDPGNTRVSEDFTGTTVAGRILLPCRRHQRAMPPVRTPMRHQEGSVKSLNKYTLSWGKMHATTGEILRAAQRRGDHKPKGLEGSI